MPKTANVPGKLVPQGGYSTFVPDHFRRHSIGRRDSSECFPTQTGSLAGWLARAGDSPTLVCSCALLSGARLGCPARLKARRLPWVSFSRLKPERRWPTVQKTRFGLVTFNFLSEAAVFGTQTPGAPSRP